MEKIFRWYLLSIEFFRIIGYNEGDLKEYPKEEDLMLEVFIIDDEVKVCNLIKQLINWEVLELEVIGMYHSGLTALTAIKQHAPDIIITDIRMPDYDGLTLIKEAQMINPDLHFIIISGYGQFDYAQKAIQYGVSDYLLKPIKAKELTATLTTIVEQHNNLNVKKQKEKELLFELNHTQKRIKANFINDILLNPDSLKNYHTVDDLNQTYYTHFSSASFTLICVWLDLTVDESPFIINDFLVNKITALTTEQMQKFHEFSISASYDHIYCLVNGSAEQMQQLYFVLKSLRSAILSLREIFPELHIMLVQSGTKNNFAEIPDCFREVDTALLEKIITGNDSIIIFPKLTEPDININEYITASFRNQYLSIIDTLNYEAFRELISGLCEALATATSITGCFIYRIYEELITLFLLYIRQHKIAPPTEAFSDQLKKDFLCYSSSNDAFSHLAEVQIDFLIDWSSKRQKTLSKTILHAKQYISGHYSEALTLEKIGQEIGLNPSYFSNVFKKETGVSFIDYLTDVRMANAKILISETDLEIFEIAERSGFNDLKYFSKCFRKVTGLTPVAYRKLFS